MARSLAAPPSTHRAIRTKRAPPHLHHILHPFLHHNPRQEIKEKLFYRARNGLPIPVDLHPGYTQDTSVDLHPGITPGYIRRFTPGYTRRFTPRIHT